MPDDHRTRRGRTGLLAAALLGLATAQAGAQAADPELDAQARGSMSAVTECYAAAEDADAARACKGRAAAACLEGSGGGGTGSGAAFCETVEAEAWDGPLNEAYQALVARAKAGDAAARESASEEFRRFDQREETLRAAQRAWLAFREAECGYAYARWGDGSMRDLGRAGCMSSMTAERAIELRRYGQEGY